MGKACTFFGHRDAPDCIKEKLIDTITQLVLYKNVDCFYVGTYVTHPWGGAAKFKRMAELKNKIVIDLNVE